MLYSPTRDHTVGAREDRRPLRLQWSRTTRSQSGSRRIGRVWGPAPHEKGHKLQQRKTWSCECNKLGSIAVLALCLQAQIRRRLA